nr:MAG TPA: zinc finger double domain protein [Bacteriophage sp.]
MSRFSNLSCNLCSKRFQSFICLYNILFKF